MEIFPALLIGGPPHSGKSVLAYSLSQAFRQRGIAHYLLRACPDGEGDWANEINQGLVRTIRIKKDWSQAFVDGICRDITRRHLPLLVDVGGRPARWQEPIFSHCTHAVLLTSSPNTLKVWQTYARRYSLTILAELESSLTAEPCILSHQPILRARLSGLRRGTIQQGPVFDALVDTLSPYFRYTRDELQQLHQQLSPAETTINLPRLARTLHIPFDNQKPIWHPRHLPDLLNYLPAGTPLALYGRGPNWLYAATALHIQPAQFYQFDARLGWVTPPALKIGQTVPDSPLQCRIQRAADRATLQITIQPAYLDYLEANGLTVPAPPRSALLILSGKLPHWLITALAITYHHVPVLAVHQPQIGNVVIKSRVAQYAPGDLLPNGI